MTEQRARPRAFDRIPGPPRRFLVGEAFTLARNPPWEVCTEWARSYGGMTRIKVMRKNVVVLNDPEVIEEVLITRFEGDDFWRDRPREAMLPAAGDANVFLSPGGDHWAARRVAHPCQVSGFADWMDRQVETISEVTRDHLERWKQSRQAASEAGIGLFVDLMCTQAFGVRSDEEHRSLCLEVADLLEARMTWSWPWKKRVGRAEQGVYDAWQALGERLLARSGPGALAGVARAAGKSPDDAAIARSVVSLPMEGGFSGASGLMNALWHLSRSEEVRSELVRALHGLSRPWTWASLDALPILGHVLREALRVSPPVPLSFRNVHRKREVELGGYRIPPNTVLFVCNWHLHHDESVWRDPWTFRPERWQNGTVERHPYGSGWFSPFGRGPRTCAGERLARMQMKVALATLCLEGPVDVVSNDDGLRFEMFFATLQQAGTSVVVGAQSAGSSSVAF